VIEAFANRVGVALASGARQPVRVTVVGHTQQTWEDFAGSQPDDLYLSTAQVNPFEGLAVLQLPTFTLRALFDLHLGGDGRVANTGAHLTEVERSMIAPLLEDAWRSLPYALSTLIESNIGAVQQAASALLVQPGRPREGCLIVEMSVSLSDLEPSMVHFCLPQSILQPITEASERSSGQAGVRRDTHDAERRSLDVPFDVNVTCPPITMSPAQLNRLHVGDWIPIVEVHDPGGWPRLDLVVGAVTIGSAIAAGEVERKLRCLVRHVVFSSAPS
jgi:flagellar motor switch protein FliM